MSKEETGTSTQHSRAVTLTEAAAEALARIAYWDRRTKCEVASSAILAVRGALERQRQLPYEAVPSAELSVNSEANEGVLGK